MNNLPEKIDQPSIDEVTSAILSYNDPQLITTALNSLGWNCNIEILETISVARQNVNLGAKMTAIKYLRTLLQETAEASGYISQVSQTRPGADGGSTTFSAKRISAALNPTKNVISKEISDDRPKPETESEKHIGITGGEGSGCPRPNTGRDSNPSNVRSESGGENTERHLTGELDRTSNPETETGDSASADTYDFENNIVAGDDNGDNPCIQHRPPTCDPKLYPGISGTSTEGVD